MHLLQSFLDPSFTSLKVCGVTTPGDAEMLVSLGVDALGVNFWPGSKRFLNPSGADWLRSFDNRILRVGVFVNANPADALELLRSGYIDVIQLHGDETPEDALPYREAKVPFFKAVGVRTAADAEAAVAFGADAVLLDAHAPGVYGGTGATFNWDDALTFRASHPTLPLLLAGGITPDCALAACRHVRPAAIDVASGSESAPGVKDPTKVRTLVEAVRASNQC